MPKEEQDAKFQKFLTTDTTFDEFKDGLTYVASAAVQAEETVTKMYKSDFIRHMAVAGI